MGVQASCFEDTIFDADGWVGFMYGIGIGIYTWSGLERIRKDRGVDLENRTWHSRERRRRLPQRVF
jgi:hypothetical protein